MNAKDYGVPQNRKRIFVVSILDRDAVFTFPLKMKLTRRLKDVLEDVVPEKYYLSDERIYGVLQSTQKQSNKGNGFAFKPTDGRDVAHAVTSRSGSRKTDNFIQKEFDVNRGQSGGVYNAENIAPTITAVEGVKYRTKVVLGWTRNRGGQVAKRPPVKVANCVTSGKRDNTQNYVVEHEQQTATDDTKRHVAQ